MASGCGAKLIPVAVRATEVAGLRSGWTGMLWPAGSVLCVRRTRTLQGRSNVARIQYRVSKETAWTPRTTHSDHRRVRRPKHDDSLKTSDETRWLVVSDMFYNIMESRDLSPGSDLRAALQSKLAELSAEGWVLESPQAKYGSTFCNRNGERRSVSIYHHDPFRVRPGNSARRGRSAAAVSKRSCAVLSTPSYRRFVTE
jgi:hypothetical protein